MNAGPDSITRTRADLERGSCMLAAYFAVVTQLCPIPTAISPDIFNCATLNKYLKDDYLYVQRKVKIAPPARMSVGLTGFGENRAGQCSGGTTSG